MESYHDYMPNSPKALNSVAEYDDLRNLLIGTTCKMKFCFEILETKIRVLECDKSCGCEI